MGNSFSYLNLLQNNYKRKEDLLWPRKNISDRGNEYKKKGDFKNAMNCYLEAIDLDPESPALEAKKMLEDIF